MTLSPTADAKRRFDAVDIARGVAVAAMVVYHFSWDLTALDFIETNVVTETGWRVFARCIAGSFLILVGIGLTLAHRGGLRLRPFLVRLAKIAAAALAITVATYFAFPDGYIFFGILHCIALGSVLALPFLRAPGWAVLVAAVLVVAAPFVLTDPAFDAPALGFLGLGAQEPATNDYVPIFPWFAAILIGLLGGRWLAASSPWQSRGRLGHAVAFVGRHSLPIYLVHQLALFGGLYGLRHLEGPNPIVQCVRQCGENGMELPLCRTRCACVIGIVRERGALDRLLAGPRSEADQAILDEAGRECRRAPAQP